MNGDEYPQFSLPENDGLTRNEKLGIAGLVVLFIVIIYLGFSQLGQNIKTPFNSFIAKYSGGESAAPLPSDEAAAMEEAKNKDTDQDGLSDYDELYIFRTSPYLPDSDSDSLADKQEVEGGTDPNCPQGRNCGGSALTSAEEAITPTSTSVAPAGGLSNDDILLFQSLSSGNVDAKAMRDFLVRYGMDKKMLDGLSDAELLAFFKKASTSTVLMGNNSSGVVDIDKITADDVRKLLLQQGINQDVLKKISDAELLKIFRESAK